MMGEEIMSEVNPPVKYTRGVLEKRNDFWGWCFIGLATILIIEFVFYPMVQAFIMSLYGGTGNNTHFAGLYNYERMLVDSTFKKALFNTFIYLIIQVPIMLLFALIVAVMLNDKHLKFKTFFRVAIFLPCVTSLVSYSLIMKAIFANQGMFNAVMMDWGILDSPILWVTDPFWAKVLIIISITWRWIGYNMVFYLAALQNIEPSVYEAADIDGAGPIKKFFTITIPLLKPIILFTTITSTIGTLQLFDEVQNITAGGPANGTVTISQYIYNLCFKFTPNFGYACAVAFVVVILIVLLSALQFVIARDKD